MLGNINVKGMQRSNAAGNAFGSKEDLEEAVEMDIRA